MRIFRATRVCSHREDVEVEANSMDEAREKFEEDTEDIHVISDLDDDYEVHDIWEVKV